MAAAIEVSRLPLDPGPAGWNRLLPAAPLPQLLETKKTADYLIIGAGFAGLSAARRLAQRSDSQSIVVLEAARLAEGPAGRNSGFMIDLPHDLASEHYGGEAERDQQEIRLNRLAIRFAEDAARDFNMSSEAFCLRGKVNAAASRKGMQHNRDYAQHLSTLAEAHEFLDATQMHELTGSTYYHGGLYTPGTAMIQPALFVRSFAAGLHNKVALFEHSPVLSLKQDAQTWVATTPQGSVSAPVVILSVNGHLQSFGFYPRHLMHVFTYASMTRQLNAAEIRALGGAPTWGVTPADPMGTTVRRINGAGGARIVVRNRFTYNPSMAVSQARIARAGRDHDRAFQQRFPMLKSVPMEYRWGGRLCLSRNKVSVFGELAPGLFSACCQNGLGVAKGTLSGMLAADLALGDRNEHVNAMLAQQAPQKIPPEPFTWLGATAAMRWSEYAAGAER